MVSRTRSVPGWEPALLERERELAQLEALGGEAKSGMGATVLIEGPAGTGKTRLVQQLRDSGGRAGMRVLSARAAELEREFSFGVVRQLFAPLLADSSDREDLLEAAAAAARPALGLDDGCASPSSGLPFAALWGLYSLTVKLGRAGPVLLTVDDAHWADTSSLRFLMFLAARLEGLSLLQAVTSDCITVESPLARLSSDPSTVRLSPTPLGSGSVASVLGDALGAPPAAAFASVIHELTGGNPFLLAEMARTLAARHVQPTQENASLVRDLVPDTVTRAVLFAPGPPT